ncbi:MAG: putative bifunctional diguanylate cyclase/phosphodiesterase [Geminicoccaceae bacterium]
MTRRSQTGVGGNTLLQRYTSMLASRRAEHYVGVALEQRSKLQQLDRLMGTVVEQSFDGIMTFDHRGLVRTVNEAACRLFRSSREELVGLHVNVLLPDLKSFSPSAHAAPADGPAKRLEGFVCRPDKSTCPVELAIRRISIGGQGWAMAILRDITAAKAHEAKLRHLAMHDALTDLPNRLLLKDRLDQALRAARRSGEPLNLAILDLDRFKEVNDTLGHQVGDALLIMVAKRLTDCVREGDTVARLGGDEFAILLPQRKDGHGAREVAERIRTALHKPFALAGCISLEIGASIGLALFPDDADTGSKLMQCADVAMYAAKRQTSGVERYDPAKDLNSIRTLVLSGGLRQAIEHDQLRLVYQPKLDLRSETIRSFEVLARWDHPEHGMIPPDEFVPQAEESGNVVPFTCWTLERTVECLGRLQEQGMAFSLAVNLSPRSLHSNEILTFVETLLNESDIQPSAITLELTETAVMLDPSGAVAKLEKLRALGLRLSIDDFGTGYSSLSLLRRLPLDEIKIDRSFIEGMSGNPQDRVIVRSTIDLAHNLGLEVVAEGVESRSQMKVLKELGCDIIQGFLVSEPIDSQHLSEWTTRAPWPLGRVSSAA